jgi:hypothetical protein
MALAWALVIGLYIAIAVFLWGAYALFRAVRTFARMTEERQKAAVKAEQSPPERAWQIEVQGPATPMIYREDSWDILH